MIVTSFLNIIYSEFFCNFLSETFVMAKKKKVGKKLTAKARNEQIQVTSDNAI
jgi:hypothetical protein